MWAPAMALCFLFAPTTDYQSEGLKALEAKQYDQAAQLFTQAVQADPKDYSAHFNLALAFSLLGKDAEAIPEFQKTLELKPGLYQAELNLGIVLLRGKRARRRGAPGHGGAGETQGVPPAVVSGRSTAVGGRTGPSRSPLPGGGGDRWQVGGGATGPGAGAGPAENADARRGRPPGGPATRSEPAPR